MSDVNKQAQEAIGKTVFSREETGVSGVVKRCPKTLLYSVRSGNCTYECGSAEELAEGWELVNHRELCSKLEAENAALAKRVAELELDAKVYMAMKDDWKDLRLQQQITIQRLSKEVKALQSQLAWTPVEDGLPTEPGMYVFVNVEADYFTLFELDPIGCWVRHEHQERVQLTAITDNWRAYRRITLPEAK